MSEMRLVDHARVNDQRSKGQPFEQALTEYFKQSVNQLDHESKKTVEVYFKEQLAKQNIKQYDVTFWSNTSFDYLGAVYRSMHSTVDQMLDGELKDVGTPSGITGDRNYAS